MIWKCEQCGIPEKCITHNHGYMWYIHYASVGYLIDVTDCHGRKIHIWEWSSGGIHSSDHSGFGKLIRLFVNETKGDYHRTESHANPHHSPAFLRTVVNVLPTMKTGTFTIFPEGCGACWTGHNFLFHIAALGPDCKLFTLVQFFHCLFRFRCKSRKSWIPDLVKWFFPQMYFDLALNEVIISGFVSILAFEWREVREENKLGSGAQQTLLL